MEDSPEVAKAIKCEKCGAPIRLIAEEDGRWLGVCSNAECGILHEGEV